MHLPSDRTATLGGDVLRRLTLWKWTYHLESLGFSTAQARRLLFVRFLAHRRGMSDVRLPLVQTAPSVTGTH